MLKMRARVMERGRATVRVRGIVKAKMGARVTVKVKASENESMLKF
jgi:hypothetical protein